MQAKELKLANENNRLECDAFVQIHFAPAIQLKESDFDKMYFVSHKGDDIFLQLVDLLRVEFGKISSIITLPATGLASQEWRNAWLQKHPETKNETMMAVYYYKRKK